MTLRVCSVPGCPNLQAESKCKTHRSEAERARGSTTARGYGAAHQRTREEWAPLVATGNVKCWRCKRYLDPAKPWHLGHHDDDRTKYHGPECVPCNTATAGR